MIKNIEELENIQIVCRNQEQVKDCLNYLKQLGFDVEDFTEYCDGCNIVFWGGLSEKFFFYDRLKNDLSIEFYNKELVKTLQKFIKEKQEKEKVEDFEVAEDGRITKVNNRESKKDIYFVDNYNQEYFFSYKENVDYCIDCGLVFATKEARDRAMFKMEIETKLKNIAERFNAGRKIDWENLNQNKFYIYYDYDEKKLDYSFNCFLKNQGTIYCLDKNFLEVAEQEIGEENLIKYFKE